jgi:hypothetical protein
MKSALFCGERQRRLVKERCSMLIEQEVMGALSFSDRPSAFVAQSHGGLRQEGAELGPGKIVDILGFFQEASVRSETKHPSRLVISSSVWRNDEWLAGADQLVLPA